MTTIDINLMGLPQVHLDGKIVHFSYKKAEALFYYIVIEKKITRDQAASMFWYECDDESAKKNLRQSLYTLKKTFGDNVIVSLPNHMLGLSETHKITCDLDEFFIKCDIGLYKGEIFQSFYVKDAMLFEEWLSKIRERTKNFYLSNYLQYLSTIPIDKLYVLEEHFNRYIDEDPFDERAYIIMLDAYLKNGLYHKGIQLYQKLCTQLDDEFGVRSSDETTKLYHQLLDNMAIGNEQKPNTASVKLHEQVFENKGLVYETQQKQFFDIYTEYLQGKGRAILLTGEMGVGKSFLDNEFLNAYVTEDTLILNKMCCMKNSKIILKPWNDLMAQIQSYISERKIDIPYNLVKAVNRLIPSFDVAVASPSNAQFENYDYMASKGAILKILRLIASSTKLIILIENLHLMDSLSLDILTGLIHIAHQEILILCTSLENGGSDTQSFINVMYNSNKLAKIALPPLTFDEAEKLLYTKSDSFDITHEKICDIYKSSQGNLFFIMEFLWNIKNNQSLDEFSPNSQDMLECQIDGLTEPSLQLLNIISIFLEYATLDELCYIKNENIELISHQISELKEFRLISEKIIDNHICFVFNHNLMRNFIYSKISNDKKRRLHDLAGSFCENIYYDLNKIYRFLIHHYSLAENHLKILSYRILILSEEIFPDYDSFINFTKDAKSNLSPSEYLQSLLNELKSTKEKQPNALEYDYLEAILLLAISRCYFLNNEVISGIKAFSLLLNGSYIWGNSKFLFKAYVQFMDYVVQTQGKNINVEHPNLKTSLTPLQSAIYSQMQAFIAMLSMDNNNAQQLLNKAICHVLEK